MSASSSISVTVRVRPFSIREAAQLERPDDAPAFFGDGSLAGSRAPKLSGKGVRRVVKVIDERMLVFDPAEENPLAKYQKTILPQGKRVKDMRFGFDRVFDENCSQQDVYECTTRSLLDSVLDGYNATVFAYGATGCGKTHTISGNPQHPGIIFLTCAELFERIRELRDEKEIDLSLSYLEIYNETIRDLLIPGGSKLGLQLREDTNQNIAVAGLSTHKPRTVEEVMDMIVMGNANRTMSPTEANATSSRSHAVLQINVIQKPRTAGVSEDHMAATLSIIDLAGSERASVTKNRGERLLEGANINRSLLALGNCINALCDPTKKNHVPYRDSKLTRLLKFSLGGNCKTVMIVCVSPSSMHYDETHNTLKYANRAKNIKTKISRNMINVNRHVSQYVKAIYDLRQEVESLKKRLADATKEAMAKINKQNVQKEACLKEGLRRVRSAFEQSGELRRDHIENLKQLRMVERRQSLIIGWLTAFDAVFENRQHEEAPKVLFKMRLEADKILQEMDDSKRVLQQRIANSDWEKVIDTALQNSLRSLQNCDGVQEHEIEGLTREANLRRMSGERDILHAIAQADVDFSTGLHTLTKALCETVSTVNRIMEGSISDADAYEAARKSLFEVQMGASDALSHIIRPNGDLVSAETYQPVYSSPRKKKFPSSPARSTGGILSAAASPVKASPRRPKVLTPKKALKFVKKSPAKKRVRWHEDVDQSEDIKRTRVADSEEVSAYVPPPTVEYLAPPPPQPLLAPAQTRASSPPSASDSPHGLAAPPVRPGSNRFQAGFLSKNKDSPPVTADEVPLPRDSDSPLRQLDTIDAAINRLKTTVDTDSDSDSWRATSSTHNKAPVRKSSAAGRPIAKRRSPSSSSQTSPEANDKWTKSQAKRMPQAGEKENVGSVTTVLSPTSTGIKAAARRLTVAGAGGSGSLRLSPAALADLKEKAASTRESTGGIGARWR